MKRLKTFESYVDSTQIDVLYDKMSNFLEEVRELYFEITGENKSFNNPEEAISYLSEFNHMTDVKDMINNIKELIGQIDDLESESYFNEFEDNEE